MNQIIDLGKNNNISNSNNLKNLKYKILFIIFSIMAILSLVILFIKLYLNNKNEEIARKLTKSYSISTLYSNNVDYSTQTQSNTSFIIGIIKIEKINVNYSILSISNNDLLDISICRFAGPMPNKIGNLCLAGHNYVDYKFFSRLNELELNDIIKIYDLTGNLIEYSIYEIYETNPNNTSCTFQDTKGLRIVTLVTCNNVNGKRLILHAKEIP